MSDLFKIIAWAGSREDEFESWLSTSGSAYTINVTYSDEIGRWETDLEAKNNDDALDYVNTALQVITDFGIKSHRELEDTEYWRGRFRDEYRVEGNLPQDVSDSSNSDCCIRIEANRDKDYAENWGNSFS